MSSTDRRKTYFRGAEPPAAELETVCQEMVISSLGDPYRHRKRPFTLPGEGTLSGMPYGRRSDVFDEE
jgi:hypothetical protein